MFGKRRGAVSDVMSISPEDAAGLLGVVLGHLRANGVPVERDFVIVLPCGHRVAARHINGPQALRELTWPPIWSCPVGTCRRRFTATQNGLEELA
jgi:hypothetical protein